MLFDVACAMQQYFRDTACPARVYFGKKHLAEHVEELRIVWVPIPRDDFGPPVQTGGKFADMYEGLNPRTFACRWANADLHIWAFAPPQKSSPDRQVEKDYAVLDALVNHTCQALQKLVTAPGYRLKSGSNDNSVQHVRRGFLYVLSVQIQIPLVEVSAFPCDKLGLDAKTWDEKPITGVAATVQEVTAIPTGTVIDSVSFTVSEE